LKLKKPITNIIKKPIQHKLHYYTFFKSPDIYYKLIYLWNKYGYREFKIDDKNYTFNSKLGNVYRKTDGETLKQNFEYVIKDERKGDIKTSYVKFMPRIKNTFQKDGKKFKLLKGEGVEIEIITVYHSMKESQELLNKIFKKLGLEKYWKYQDKTIGSVRQNEHYIRYDAKKEQMVANTLGDIQELIRNSGDGETKITINKEEGKYNLLSLRSECFDDLGFNNNNKKWVFAIKTYRAREWRQFEEHNPLHHPKFEIYLDEDKKKGKRKYPNLADYEKLTSEMYNIIGNIFSWSQVNNNDLISDLYFDSDDEEDIEINTKENVLEKLKERYKRIFPEIRKEVNRLPSKRDYLNCLINYGEVTYKTLTEWTNLSKDWIKRITYSLEEEGIIHVTKGNNVCHGFFGSPVFIRFATEKMKNITKAIVRDIDVQLEENKEKIEERKTKRGIRREKYNTTMRKKTISKRILSEIEKQKLFDIKIIKELNDDFYSLEQFKYINMEMMPDIDIGG
jgi:hypothetical protein